jgi:hypothetical protein
VRVWLSLVSNSPLICTLDSRVVLISELQFEYMWNVNMQSMLEQSIPRTRICDTVVLLFGPHQCTPPALTSPATVTLLGLFAASDGCESTCVC